MLNIFADSLLLATRMTPISRGYGDERDEIPAAESTEDVRRRPWFGFMGILL